MPTPSNFDKFSAETKTVLLKAQEFAEGKNRGIIGSEHLLLGLLTLPTQSTARELLGEYIEIDYPVVAERDRPTAGAESLRKRHHSRHHTTS